MLDRLAEPERRALLARMHRRRFAKGEVLFHEGDPGDTLHLIAKGHVALRVTSPRGDSVVLRVLGRGSLVGEFSVISPGPRSATVVALDPTETMTLGRDEFEQLRDQQPEIDRMLLDAAIAEVRRLSLALRDALYLPVEERLLRRLAELAALYRSDDQTIKIPIGQDDLAGIAGAARQTANRILAKAQASGVICVHRGCIEVLDLDALERHP